MKKLLLFALTVSLSLTAYTQNLKTKAGVKGKPASVGMKPMKAQTAALNRDESSVRKQIQSPTTRRQTGMHTVSTFTEAIIGSTIYDLQSNRGTAKRISNNGDGTLSTVWNMTPVGGTNGVDRGTGYNYYNGTNWGPSPTTRIEAIRTGFTNLDVTQAGEFVVAHTTGSSLSLTERPVKGTGAWSEDTVGTFNLYPLQADVWSRMGVGGPAGNTVRCMSL